MENAILAFEDGTVFKGKAFGAKKTALGEAVFNTSMMGYEQLLSDPSNYKNILVMTFVEIGNYGFNESDAESGSIKAAGLVVAQECDKPSNWRSQTSLNDYLVKNGVPAIAGVDTRAIARKLRDGGALKACLSTEGISEEDAVARAKAWEGVSGVDSAKDVCCKEPYNIDAQKIDLEPFKLGGVHIVNKPRRMPLIKCAAIDFGAAASLLKSLAYSGFDVTVFPARATAEEILASNPQCLFLTTGAGDPSALGYAHKTVAELAKKLPTLGVGMGHQILAHAFGAKTFKLKFGHHGGNHPVRNFDTGKVRITSQNNAYSVDEKSVEGTGLRVSEANLNDGAVAGLRHESLPVFSVQYHPEAAPGASGESYILEEFYNLAARAK